MKDEFFFQDTWITKLSWEKSFLDDKGELHQVQNMHIFLKEKYKLLAPKLDNLFKQQGCWKVKVSIPNVDGGTCYFDKNLMHIQNKCNYNLGPTQS